ncbi:MAG TPA: hypothetical protein PK347_13710 [Burkholderiaceae bacterium]|nr:hypothetical protein [Burkholderiaceae bacterium]
MKSILHIKTFCALLCAVLTASASHAQVNTPGIVGKNGWLYYQHEFDDDTINQDTSIELIGKITKLLEQNGTMVLVAMAPIKGRIYAEYLPTDLKPTRSVLQGYDRMLKALRSKDVKAVDLNKTFLANTQKNDSRTTFLRHDTHWSAFGALLAAESIRDEILATASLKQAINSLPEVKYDLNWSDVKVAVEGDLIQQLPKGSPSFEKEQRTVFSVQRAKSNTSDALLGSTADIGIALMGTSYSADWTQFPSSLRYVLQKDILSMSVTADKGHWYGLESYLNDPSFQSKRPKLLIWEMPERDMKAPPDFEYREQAYRSDTIEWLLRNSALILNECKPSATKASITTNSQGVAEVSFEKPLSKLEYIQADVINPNARELTFDASGQATAPRKWTVATQGTTLPYTIKLPLIAKSKGFSKLKLTSNDKDKFQLVQLRVCRQPDDILN